MTRIYDAFFLLIRVYQSTGEKVNFIEAFRINWWSLNTASVAYGIVCVIKKNEQIYMLYGFALLEMIRNFLFMHFCSCSEIRPRLKCNGLQNEKCSIGNSIDI